MVILRSVFMLAPILFAPAAMAQETFKEFCFDNGCQTAEIRLPIVVEPTYPDLKIINYERSSEDQQVPNRFTAVVNCAADYLITDGQMFEFSELNAPSMWVAEQACYLDWASTRTE